MPSDPIVYIVAALVVAVIYALVAIHRLRAEMRERIAAAREHTGRVNDATQDMVAQRLAEMDAKVDDANQRTRLNHIDIVRLRTGSGPVEVRG